MSQQRTPRYNGAEAWSDQEKQMLHDHMRAGDTYEAISEAIGRTEESVKSMAKKMQLHRRRHSEPHEHYETVDEYMKKHGGD